MLSALLLCVLGMPPAEVEVAALPFDPASWKAGSLATIEVKEGEKAVTYAGVPLRRVLVEARLVEAEADAPGAMAAFRELSDAVILLKAGDGYQVAVSAAAAALDPPGERYFLALLADGKPLPDGQGPARLIVAGESPRVRWIRMISGIDLVRLPKPGPAPARGR